MPQVLHMVPGGYHEVLFSPGVADQLEREMVGWILAHAAAGGGGGGAGAGVGAGGGGASGSGGAAAKM